MAEKYQPRTEMYDHQRRAIRAAWGRTGFAYLMDTRTGKSKTLIDEWCALHEAGRTDGLLVLAPKGVYMNWVKDEPGDPGEFARHMPERLRSRAHVVEWRAGGGGSAHRRRLESMLEARGVPRVLVMNSEALSSGERGRAMAEAFLRSCDAAMLAVDECFPAGTRVAVPGGTTRIEDLHPGDVVSSSRGVSRIRKVLRKKSNLLVKLTLADGRAIRCTPNHPFFTDLGWMSAVLLEGRRISATDYVQGLCERVPREDSEEVLQRILLSEQPGAAGMEQGYPVVSGYAREVECGAPRVALPEERDPHVGGAEDQDTRDGARAKDTRAGREWSGAPRSTDVAADHVRLALENGARHRIGQEAARLSNMLQGRLGRPGEEAGDRVRRGQPQHAVSAGEGPEEGRQTEGTRVVCVEVEEYSNPVDVFDLQLDGAPHFFAEDALVHNSVDFGDPSSNRTKALLGARGVPGLRDMAAYRRILNGLLSPRGPLQVWSQFEILEPACLGFRSFFSFKCRYAVTQRKNFGGRKVDVVVGYREQEDLARRVARHSFRVRRDECWDLPRTVYSSRDVELTSEQRRIYDELVESAVAQLAGEEYVSATSVITQILRLHQVVCGHVTDEGGTVRDVPSHRVRELLRVVEATDDKVVVWCHFRRSVEHVVEGLVGWEARRRARERGETEPSPEDLVAGRWAVAEYHGGCVETRVADLARFQSDPECRFIVCTDAAAKGVKMTAAGTMVYFANGYSWDKRSQSEDRPLGPDQRGAVHCVDLVARGTVDEKILRTLRERKDLSSAIMGDAYREWLI